MYNILYCFVMSCQYVLMSGYPQSVWNSLFVFSPTLSSQFIVFWQYSSDAVSSVRSTSTHFISIRPCFHHAGGNHEPYRRDAATGGAAHDDQENAGDLRYDRELKKTFCVCVPECADVHLSSFCRVYQLHCLCWRSGRPVSLVSSSLRRGMRSSSGRPSLSSRSASVRTNNQTIKLDAYSYWPF